MCKYVWKKVFSVKDLDLTEAIMEEEKLGCLAKLIWHLSFWQSKKSASLFDNTWSIHKSLF